MTTEHTGRKTGARRPTLDGTTEIVAAIDADRLAARAACGAGNPDDLAERLEEH